MSDLHTELSYRCCRERNVFSDRCLVFRSSGWTRWLDEQNSSRQLLIGNGVTGLFVMPGYRVNITY